MYDFLATAPCGFLSFSDNGALQYVNPPLLAMLGCKGTGEPRELKSLFTPATRLFFNVTVFPSLKLRGRVDEIFLSLLNSDGTEIPFLLNAVRVVREGVTCNDAVLMPVVARGHFEDELLRERKEAMKANAAKDQFLASLSHELRTPLTPILLTAMALEADMDVPPEIRDHMTMIRRNAELEARLIDDLLDITRIVNGKLRLISKEANIHELLAQTIELIKEDYQAKQLDLSLELNAALPYTWGDGARLLQIFWNLLKNAVKFTPAGGSIRVETSNPDPSRILIKVTDTGIGMPPEALANVFQAFQQGTPEDQHRFGGLGLGLAISAGIVEMHKGTIKAQSPGVSQGSTFLVELSAIPIPIHVPPAGFLPRQAATPSLRILLVEDHEATRHVLLRLLARAGHAVIPAGNAEAALALADSHPFDVVISDLGLPGCTGLELMSELRSRHHLVGIALSGYGMEEDLASSLSAGFFAHLVKPVRMDELKELLSQVPTSGS